MIACAKQKGGYSRRRGEKTQRTRFIHNVALILCKKRGMEPPAKPLVLETYKLPHLANPLLLCFSFGLERGGEEERRRGGMALVPARWD